MKWNIWCPKANGYTERNDSQTITFHAVHLFIPTELCHFKFFQKTTKILNILDLIDLKKVGLRRLADRNIFFCFWFYLFLYKFISCYCVKKQIKTQTKIFDAIVSFEDLVFVFTESVMFSDFKTEITQSVLTSFRGGWFH